MAPAMRMLSTRAMAKEVTVIGFKDKGFRTKQSSTTKRAQLLSRVEELRLLTKAEEAGLIAAASDPGTPGALSAAGLALLALGPAAVYLLPDDSATLVAVQVAVAALCAGGGAAALGASALLGDLQSKKA